MRSRSNFSGRSPMPRSPHPETMKNAPHPSSSAVHRARPARESLASDSLCLFQRERGTLNGVFTSRRGTSKGLDTKFFKTVCTSFSVFALSLVAGFPGRSQAAQVEVHVEYTRSSGRLTPPDSSDTVIWLTPLSEPLTTRADTTLTQFPHHFRLVQSHKRFDPHLLVVPVGSAVDFPNEDPFFHNVFSLFNGTRFDLGLYEAGATRGVKFDRAGVSYIFCNIHPQMSAVVIAVETPYYGVTNKLGIAIIRNVPDGRYRLRIWSEHALPKALAGLTEEVIVLGKRSDLGLLSIPASGDLLANHKDLYGRDYDPVTTVSPSYQE